MKNTSTSKNYQVRLIDIYKADMSCLLLSIVTDQTDEYFHESDAWLKLPRMVCFMTIVTILE
jgi:hypothetical protein